MTVHYNALLAMLNARDKLANRHAMANQGVLDNRIVTSQDTLRPCKMSRFFALGCISPKVGRRIGCELPPSTHVSSGEIRVCGQHLLAKPRSRLPTNEHVGSSHRGLRAHRDRV